MALQKTVVGGVGQVISRMEFKAEQPGYVVHSRATLGIHLSVLTPQQPLTIEVKKNNLYYDMENTLELT